MTARQVTVIGAGPCGLLTAALLARRGYAVRVFEKRPDPTKESFEDHRSMNFTLSPRGVECLEMIGAWRAIGPLCVKVAGRSVHKAEREKLQLYSPDNPSATTLHSVTRLSFIRAFVEYVRDNFDLEINFEAEFLGFDKRTSQVQICRSGEICYYNTDLLVGADGANSKVAEYIRRSSSSSVDLWTFDWKYKRFELAPSEALTLGLKMDFVHFFPTKNLLVLALPNLDGSFSCNLFFKQSVNSDTWNTDKDSFSNRSLVHSKLKIIIDHQFGRNPASHIRSHLEGVWHHGDKVVILGDAAHSVFHFFAQGLNCALEDVKVFINTLDQSGSPSECFRRFYDLRIGSIRALRIMSKDHFYFLTERAGSMLNLVKERTIQWIAAVSGMRLENTYAMVVRPEYTYEQALSEIALQRSVIRFAYRAFFKPSKKVSHV
jgi:kynurenine 3-monooxygenase